MTAAATTTASTPLVAPEYTAALVELKNEISLLKTSVKPPNTTPVTVDYAAELVALKQDLKSLCTFITTTVEQLTMDIASLDAAPVVGDMETDNASWDHTADIPDLIDKLKHDIATLAMEMRAKFVQLATQKLTKTQKCTSVT